MKKKLPPTPATTEAPAPSPVAEKSAYVLLSDGTPARRLKPITISGRRYWNLAVTGNGKVKRVPDERLADFCEPSAD